MDKQQLVLQIVELLELEAENLANAAKIAHADATGEESKSENKYDTRGLEAAYLSGAQAAMAADIRQNIDVYKKLIIQDFSHDSKIMLTALIELESENGSCGLYFLGPNGGGLEIPFEGNKVMLITPNSPLGRNLIGREVGDFVEIVNGATKKGYEIIGLC